MTYLFVFNDHPYESERDYNGLRLATAIAEDEDNSVNVFLVGDAVFSAVAGQAAPEGRDDIPWMLARFSAGHRRGRFDRVAYRSTLAEAERVMVF
jgi:uncharacterized protein involved in oxidation of intracellular sulfur